MIARGLEGGGQALENRASVVLDARGFAMHQLRGADYFAAEGLANRLVAQAHAEDGQAARQLLDHRKRHACFIRIAWARGEQHTGGPRLADLLDADAVVQTHVTLATQALDVLDQIVRKGVVVIDDHDALVHEWKRYTRVSSGQCSSEALGARSPPAVLRQSFSVGGASARSLRGDCSMLCTEPDLKLAHIEAGR